MGTQNIELGTVVLVWCEWVDWHHFSPQQMPSSPGVYELKQKDDVRRLAIGKSRNMRARARRGLLRPGAESAKQAGEIMVRWASTERPAAALEELLRRHYEAYREPPSYRRLR